jgi:maltooligosyltrehalose trehalohydrolase
MTETFRVWAPLPHQVSIVVDGSQRPMAATGAGWWESTVDSAGPGSRYGFVLDGAEPIADPRSLSQPDGVHGLSAVYHHTYEWSDRSWTGRPLPGAVIYELHIGTFTADGTLDSAIDRLDFLVGLGIDFVELMPMNAFNGVWGWGYDGVLWYAVHQPYGGPDALKRFVDACHQRGLGVLLDAVYNHLGPSGGHLDEFGPYFAGRTIWGPTLNLSGPDSDEVRRYVIDNVISWLRDFHIDGLRLDAVHALSDNRAMHLLEQLAVEVEALAAHVRRPLTLIAESDLNDPRLITERSAGGYGLDAQWDDDIHHCLHTALTGERQGYYADFGSIEGLARTLEKAFFHAGTYSTFRRRHHGRPVNTLSIPGSRFLAYASNHDQIGNRATGDRPSATLSRGLLAVAAAIVLTSPYTPMLFMGEEWGARTPFQFFSSHPEPKLIESTRAGRFAEFADHGWKVEDVPDPMDPATFQRSKLDWSTMDTEMLGLYRKLIALRREWPDLTDARLDQFQVDFSEDERWLVLRRGRLRVIANLSDIARTITLDQPGSRVLLDSSESTVDGTTVGLAAESFSIVHLADL